MQQSMRQDIVEERLRSMYHPGLIHPHGYPSSAALVSATTIAPTGGSDITARYHSQMKQINDHYAAASAKFDVAAEASKLSSEQQGHQHFQARHPHLAAQLGMM